MQEEIPKETVHLDDVFTSNYYRQLEIINKSKSAKYVKVKFENELNCNSILPISLSYKVGFRNS